MTAAALLLLGSLTLRTELGIGADYTTQRYQVGSWDTLNQGWQEADTLNVETEGRAGLTFRLGYREGGHRLDASNTAGASTRSVRDRLNLWYEREFLPALSLRAGNEAELRHYHDWFPKLADTLYRGRDYWSNASRVELRLRPADRLRLTASESFELLRYAEPDSYYYDYHLNRARLSGWWEPGLFTTANFGTGWNRRRAGTDPERDYDEYELRAGLEHLFERGFQLGGGSETRRREYRAGRWSSGWEQALSLSAGRSFGRVGLELENEARWSAYDSSTAVYPSLFENRLGLAVELAAGTGTRLRAGPWLETGTGIAGHREDDYRELSVLAGLDVFGSDRFWLSLEDRLGLRQYPNADTTWQTAQYSFNELSLFGNWTVLRGRAGELRLEAMASVTPEWHARASDDFLLAIYSLDIKYGF